LACHQFAAVEGAVDADELERGQNAIDVLPVAGER
jgi:hypothetical protein